jgi:hypothetical protein
MTRRPFVLPVITRALEDARAAVRGQPTVDAARERLGGRAASCAPVGEIVLLSTALGERTGVVLFRDDAFADVWIGGGRVHRVEPDALVSHPDPASVSMDLCAVASSTRVFGDLREGDRVRFETRPGALSDGLLVEKCRFGALVLADDGKVMALGFQKIWPVSHTET